MVLGGSCAQYIVVSGVHGGGGKVMGCVDGGKVREDVPDARAWATHGLVLASCARGHHEWRGYSGEGLILCDDLRYS